MNTAVAYQFGYAEEDAETELQAFTGRNVISRKKIFGFLVACVVFQISLSLFILIDAGQGGEATFSAAPTADLGFSKFVAAMVMHIQMNNEIFNGLKMIKYSVNHPWKFKQE